MFNNFALENLSGLDNLSTIGGRLSIDSHNALASVAALSSVTSINGILQVIDCSVLTTLSGFENIDPSGITQVSLQLNDLLTDCAINSVCGHLLSGGSAVIQNNGVGCGSEAEVEALCPSGPACPMGDVTLTTQADVDAFVADFPDCTEVDGNLIIGVQGGSSDISDISGLSGITAVYGGCYFYNTQLTNFNGVGSITTVQGECVIVGLSLIHI